MNLRIYEGKSIDLFDKSSTLLAFCFVLAIFST